MAESERLDVLQPQQNNEPNQVSADEGDVILDGDGEELEAVVVNGDGSGGEDEEDDDENDEDETQRGELRRLTPELETTESLSSVAPKKSDNLDVAASAATAVELIWQVIVDDLAGSLGNSGLETRTEARFKEQVELSQQEVPQCISPQNSRAGTNNQLQLWVCPSPLSELSPTSVTQPISAAPSPTLPGQRLSLWKGSTLTVQEANLQTPSHIRRITMPVLKTPIPDGYNWRKYGQKQVKSPNGSRSYYRCTYSDCCAKKIECSDHSGHVIEIVKKGLHSHDLPQKSNSKRESRVATPGRPIPRSTIAEHAVLFREPDPAVLSEQPMQGKIEAADVKYLDSSASGESDAAEIKEKHTCEPEPKKRLNKDSLDCPDALFRPGKKNKFVVHAAGDVGISGDGYRWRKYGQKMVKGNAHPRNYYRCTSAGCPVRKHIETAAENSSAVIITYKGVHDHDMPVPKKRHGPPSASLVAAAAAAGSMNAVQQQKSSMKWSTGKEGEVASETSPDAGGDKDKAIESARTLLSIGFEIKPC
ncbi:Probable WRKY transcription factor 32 [Linum perenne]